MTPEKVEFKDIAVVGGAIALTGLGVILALKKPAVSRRLKKGGDTVGASISFYGRGNAGIYQVGFGVAAARLVSHSGIMQFYVKKLQLALTSEWKKFGPFSVSGTLPAVILLVSPVLGGLKGLDVFLFIQTGTGELKADASGFLPGSKWIDDVYEVIT